MALTHASRKVWNRESYYRLAESGALAPGERVELIEGEIITVSPQNFPHAYTVGMLTTELVLLFSRTHVVRSQLPLDLGSLSQPEPDFALVTLEAHRNSRPHPNTADLIIEISDSSLSFDRNEKIGVYAKAGLPEVWIFNLRDRQVEIYRQPGPDSESLLGFAYLHKDTLKHGRLAPLFAPQLDIQIENFFSEE